MKKLTLLLFAFLCAKSGETYASMAGGDTLHLPYNRCGTLLLQGGTFCSTVEGNPAWLTAKSAGKVV